MFVTSVQPEGSFMYSPPVHHWTITWVSSIWFLFWHAVFVRSLLILSSCWHLVCRDLRNQTFYSFCIIKCCSEYLLLWW